MEYLAGFGILNVAYYIHFIKNLKQVLKGIPCKFIFFYLELEFGLGVC